MSKVILSVFLNVKNVRNFSAVACTKNWDLSSGCRPCGAVNQHWGIAVNKSSPHTRYFPSISGRWCSTGSAPSAVGAVPELIRSDPTEAALNIFENLPSIPAPPQIIHVEKVLELAPNGEPTLQSLGIGGWGFRGVFEETLMAIHVHLGLPWWGSIAVGALCMRCLLFPLTVKSQRASSKTALYMPQINEAYEKMTEARKQDDHYLVFKYSKQVEELQNKAGSPFASLLPSLGQTPFIFGYFGAIRIMSTLPVESFKTGGTLWFTDLTVTDSYYGLPLITAVGLFAVLKLNGQAFAATKYGPYIPYAAPPVAFLVSMFFTNAVGVYWAAASGLNLVQSLILRNPTIREKLDLAPIVTNPPKTTKKTAESFIKGVKKNMENARIAREVEDRYRLDAIAFEKAGRESVKKTYKIDPTKNLLSKT